MSRAVPSGVKSLSLLETKRKTLRLYRECLRSAHDIVALYGIDRDPKEIRQAMRRQFETHRNLRDIALADMLLWKGRLELEETKSLFKTKAHVMQYLPAHPTDRVIAHRDFRQMAIAGKTF